MAPPLAVSLHPSDWRSRVNTPSLYAWYIHPGTAAGSSDVPLHALLPHPAAPTCIPVFQVQLLGSGCSPTPSPLVSLALGTPLNTPAAIRRGPHHPPVNLTLSQRHSLTILAAQVAAIPDDYLTSPVDESDRLAQKTEWVSLVSSIPPPPRSTIEGYSRLSSAIKNAEIQRAFHIMDVTDWHFVPKDVMGQLKLLSLTHRLVESHRQNHVATKINALLDSGSNANVISLSFLKQLHNRDFNIKIRPYAKPRFSTGIGGRELLLGSCLLTFSPGTDYRVRHVLGVPSCS
ncbi:hypothetical protein BC829DRAFT_417722 [Chytridium lagenaria]|nr:hypothetical protein BC829DRAFT_417722 [Chytridium lagenaria]